MNTFAVLLSEQAGLAPTVRNALRSAGHVLACTDVRSVGALVSPNDRVVAIVDILNKDRHANVELVGQLVALYPHIPVIAIGSLPSGDAAPIVALARAGVTDVLVECMRSV